MATSTAGDWAERLERDTTLRAFVEARIAQAGIDVAVAKAEAQHWRRAAERLDAKLRELQTGDTRLTNKRRQARHRRRHAFISIYAEGPTT